MRIFKKKLPTPEEIKKQYTEYKSYTLLNLEGAPRILREKYELYKTKYKSTCTSSEERDSRDQKFERLLEDFEKDLPKHLLQNFYNICTFVLTEKDSGCFGTAPELIKYIKQFLYSIFGLKNDLSMRPAYTTAFGQIIKSINSIEIKEVNETDYLKAALNKKLKEFCKYHQMFHDKPLPSVLANTPSLNHQLTK